MSYVLLIQDKTEDGEDDDDYEDDEDDEIDETALESYETILDKEDCPVEEYQIFKGVLECTFPSTLFCLFTELLYISSFARNKMRV